MIPGRETTGGTPVAAPAEACMVQAEWQRLLFAEQPHRKELLQLTPCWELKSLRLHVHRNQAFEFVASVLGPFLAYAGYEAEISYSDYDDSLSMRLGGAADVNLIWLDFERYRKRFGPQELARWLADRIAYLSRSNDAPVLAANWGASDGIAGEFNACLGEELSGAAGVHIVDQAAIQAELGERYFDRRAVSLAGMSLSDAACIRTAQALGLVWLPGILEPRIKAVGLDLDNTLYAGVLGEDGPDGIGVDHDYRALHRRLLELRAEGVLLAVISKNSPEDVDRLFTQRDDVLLRKDHFSALAVDWRPKSEGLRLVAERLRIGVDSILFVDDNPGELASVASELPGIRCLHAGPDVLDTLRALSFYPCLTRIRDSGTDALRADDMAANEERRQLAGSAFDPVEYLRSLKVELAFDLNPTKCKTRLYELSNKTNQFNLALKRLSEVEVARRLEAADCFNVTVSLKDRLSDSGVIAALLARREGDGIIVDELCISCRALGRQLEDLMVTEALRAIAEAAGSIRRVGFAFVEGPRNHPGRDWLKRYTGASLEKSGEVWIVWDSERASAMTRVLPVAVHWQNVSHE